MISEIAEFSCELSPLQQSDRKSNNAKKIKCKIKVKFPLSIITIQDNCLLTSVNGETINGYLPNKISNLRLIETEI